MLSLPVLGLGEAAVESGSKGPPLWKAGSELPASLYPGAILQTLQTVQPETDTRTGPLQELAIHGAQSFEHTIAAVGGEEPMEFIRSTVEAERTNCDRRACQKW